MGLKILHLSDIHFYNYDNHKYLDLDKDIQSELKFDLSCLKEQFGKIDIILIGGDIAFSGRSEEYAIADDWIKEICSITGCGEENVLTVPGNHDVDRKKISKVLKDTHDKFRSLRNRNSIDSQLSSYIQDVESSKILLSPFTNYNTFAQKYGSIPQGDNVLYWEKDFNLDNSILRIRGVNSALVSNETDDENTSKLILGSHQSMLIREKGVIYLVLCHHPPQWLYDGEDVSKDLKLRARIQLFGHKHSFDSEIVNNASLVLSAGAMQPSRKESGWDPRYNILDLGILENNEKHVLTIKLHKRCWSKQKKKFDADYSDGGASFTQYEFQLSPEEIKPSITKCVEIMSELTVATMSEPVIDTQSPNPMRKLAYMFLGLPYHVKLTIAVELGLIENSDENLGEIQKTQLYFKRAIEKNKLSHLWDKVTNAIGEKLENPFMKN